MRRFYSRWPCGYFCWYMIESSHFHSVFYRWKCPYTTVKAFSREQYTYVTGLHLHSPRRWEQSEFHYQGMLQGMLPGNVIVQSAEQMGNSRLWINTFSFLLSCYSEHEGERLGLTAFLFTPLCGEQDYRFPWETQAQSDFFPFLWFSCFLPF